MKVITILLGLLMSAILYVTYKNSELIAHLNEKYKEKASIVRFIASVVLAIYILVK